MLGAKLENANLEGAFLERAILGGANLAGANLRGAKLAGARLDNAILPDHTTWTPGTDMARFTDPSHVRFWDPDGAAPAANRLDQAGE